MKSPSSYYILMLLALLIISCFDENNNAQTKFKKNIKDSLPNIKRTEQQIIPKIIGEIPVPVGYMRIQTKNGSFGDYLRNLKLNTKDKKVYAYNGNIIQKENGYQYAVIDIDIGNRDLQQCADAVMRLRAEYLYSVKKYNQIHFNFLSDGKPRYYTQYAGSNHSYKKFRSYMNYIFTYANTKSLIRELTKVNDIRDIHIGDVFIQTGKPFGHAVIVVDVAENIKTGNKIFMVVQSFMPAQSLHIMKSTQIGMIDPWYSINFNKSLNFPSWVFYKKDLYRFK